MSDVVMWSPDIYVTSCLFQDKLDASFGNGFGPPEIDERYWVVCNFML